MSEGTNHTSPFQHHHPRTQPIKANHKYCSPICIQPSLRALVSNGYAIPSNDFGLGSFYPSPYPSQLPWHWHYRRGWLCHNCCLLAHERLPGAEPGFSEIFWCKKPIHASMSHTKRWTSFESNKCRLGHDFCCAGEGREKRRMDGGTYVLP